MWFIGVEVEQDTSAPPPKKLLDPPLLMMIIHCQIPGGGLLGLRLAGSVPLASQSPYPIIVYFLANYRPHLSHFLENVIFAIPT